MQRTIGNRAVQRILSAGVIQPKLKIGTLADRYEKEADWVADRVVSRVASVRPGEGASRKGPPDQSYSENDGTVTNDAIRQFGAGRGLPRVSLANLGASIGNRALVRILGSQAYHTPTSAVPRLSRKCSCGGKAEGECKECAASRLAREGHSSRDLVGSEAPVIVEEVLATPGKPLQDSVRRSLEPSFGYDFSRIRVHDDSKSAESGDAAKALAYTVGRHVVFARGQYALGTSQGDRLLAHELTHTIQQGAASPGPIDHRQPDSDDSGAAKYSPTSSAVALQRFHVDASGRKAFDCSHYAGDSKLEACLNDEDRLRPSDTGAPVAKVQRGLLSDGEDLGPKRDDGVYGWKTSEAVRIFKTKYRLGFEQYADVGPGTMAKLDELCGGGPPGPGPVPPGPGPTPPACPPCPEEPRTAGCPPCQQPPQEREVFVCARPVHQSVIPVPLLHTFFRIGDDTIKAENSQSLFPQNRSTSNQCWQGDVEADNKIDQQAADAVCQPANIRESCLKAVSASYPIGHYCLQGPNSNTYVGQIIRSCHGTPPNVPGVPVAFEDDPPPAGTFASQDPERPTLSCPIKQACEG